MLEEIRKRKSIRKYNDTPVTVDELSKLLHAGMMAPSACNTQNWKFIATTRKEDLIAISEMHPNYSMAKNASAAIIAMGQPDIKFGQFTEVNVAAAIENILLEATHLKLGAVWCAIHPIEERLNKMRKYFEIDEKYLPIGCIVIGHTDDVTEKQDQYDDTKVIWRL